MAEEQQFHELEQRYVSLRKEYESVCNERGILQSKVSSLEDMVSELRGVADSSHVDVAKHENEIKQRDAKYKSLEQSMEKLNDQYRRKCEESDRLRDDIKMQADQLSTLQGRLREVQNSLTEAEGQLLPVQFDLAKCSREKGALESRVAWLESELDSRTKELYEVRQKSSGETQELEALLAQKTNESTDRLQQVDQLKDRATLQEEKISELMEEVKNLQEATGKQQADFVAEVGAQRRLAELYKSHLDDALKKIDELEDSCRAWKESHGKQAAQFKARLAEQVDRATEALAKHQEESRQREEALRSELEGARLQQEQTQQQQSPGREVAVVPPEFESLGITEMYDRVVKAEREAVGERSRRRELELYLDRILKDVENKAPLIAAQRKDHMRVLESHAQLTKKLDSLISESGTLRLKLEEAEKERREAVAEATALEAQNKDLGKQIQHLLKRSMGMSSTPRKGTGEGAADGVISEYLVTFDDIEELQTRNMQLVKVIRTLSAEQVSSSSREVSVVEKDEDLQETLATTLEELAQMRESRQRMEDMVASLVQQRDIYRAMVEEVDGVSEAQGKAITNTPTSPAAGGGYASSKATEALQMKLAEAEEANSRLKDRLCRLEHIEQSLSDAVDKSREELSSVRAQLAQATSEARFHEHRVGTLESALKAAQQSYETATSRRSEMEGLLMSQQREVRAREETIFQLKDQLRAASESARTAQVEAEVCRSAEQRLLSQVGDLREELKRQSALSESVYRIEASLASRVQEEREALESEVEGLNKTLDRVRREHSETTLMHEQKMQTLEEELRIARGTIEQRTADNTSLREDLLREQGISKSAQDRAAVLERQLTIAQDRLSSIQGAQTSDSILAAENAQREVELEKAHAEIDSLKNQLQAAESHAEQFRKISASTESALKELRERSAAARSSLEEEVAALRKDLEASKQELVERRQSLIESVKEADSVREAAAAAAKKHEEEVAHLREECELAKAAETRAMEQMTALKADTSVFEAAAKEAAANYERELQLHAQAAASLRKAESRLETLQTDLADAQERVADLSAKVIAAERALDEERGRTKNQLDSNNEDMAALRHTNDLLHSQIQSMSSQLSRMQNERVDALVEENPESVQDGEQASSTDELIDLRQAAAELREVVRYMKRERDMLEARLSLTETEKNRRIAECSATQKALDEARSELKKEIESRSQNARSEEEFTRLMNEITQLNVVRESNSHLRAENNDLKTEKASMQAQLEATKSEIAPLKENIVRLEATVHTLEAEKVALTTDATYWKDRLHQLVSRYNDVDPEEHRELKESLAKAEANVEELRTNLETTKTRLEAVEAELAEKNTETASMMSTAEVMEKNSENLRTRLREFNRQNREQRTQITRLTGRISELQEECEKLKNEKNAADAAAAEALKAAKESAAAKAVAATSTRPPKPAPEKEEPAPSGPATSSPEEPSGAATPAPTGTEGAVDPASLKSMRDDLLRRMASKKANAASAGVARSAQDDSDAPATKKSRPSPAPPTTAAPAAPAVSAAPCHFFNTPAGCRNGDNCRFQHVKSEPSAAQPASTSAESVRTVAEPVEPDSAEQVAVSDEKEEVPPSEPMESSDATLEGGTEEMAGEEQPAAVEEQQEDVEVPAVADMAESTELAATETGGGDSEVTSSAADTAQISKGPGDEETSKPMQTFAPKPAFQVPSQSSSTFLGLKPKSGSIFQFKPQKTSPSSSEGVGSNTALNAFAAAFAPKTVSKPSFSSPFIGKVTGSEGSQEKASQETNQESTSSATKGVDEPISEQDVGEEAVKASDATPHPTPPQSPFLNLRPPSPSSAKVTIQFGSGVSKPLPIPTPAPSSSGSGAAPFKGFGGSLFKSAAANQAPSSGAPLSQAGQPVRALPQSTTSTSPVEDTPADAQQKQTENEGETVEVDEPETTVDASTDEPKGGEPKAEEPKADEPKADEPKADEPKEQQNESIGSIPIKTMAELTPEQRRLIRFARFSGGGGNSAATAPLAGAVPAVAPTTTRKRALTSDDSEESTQGAQTKAAKSSEEKK
mmetsp:Transcript_24386/g.35802  ORF Transcript_24386/g.35802 Transcript_24386/m.35802 type:complete len:2045 (-) Transcript_24386:88-6222(-)|eukprot:CAMPEP_0185034560 /NCGR_PEP_ID=MMETSP1103-20130426/24555_1 /TAXON_ID=36769 /ORGANISM="Paraphysomonas bandaiensis, Strain Caron Lab Isolate" /LENGTH=2044 /DNA_ID=CAMNT_0027571267 /DNA_START=34 /DNA_END=6168 /DNA_ORIENTATION=-